MTEIVRSQRHTVSITGFANPLTLDANAEEASHVHVYVDDTELTLGVDFTLDGVGDTGDLDEIAGVEVTITDPGEWAAFDTFTVVHIPPMDQNADLSGGGQFGIAFELALDAIARRMQRLSDRVDRKLGLRPSATGIDVLLPNPPIPGRALKWNEAGDGFDNSLADPDSDGLVEASEFADAAEASALAAAASATAADGSADSAAQANLDANDAADRAETAAAEAGDLSAILPYLTPVGTSIMFNGTSAPTYYLKENGAAVSRTTYSALFALIGTTFGVGDGSTTFNVPESRGEFFRGLDDGRGVDSGRTIGSAQAEMIGPHTHTATMSTAGAHTHDLVLQVRRGANGDNSPGYDGGDVLLDSSNAETTTSNGNHSHTITVNNNSGTENRPRNKAKLMCIKY